MKVKCFPAYGVLALAGALIITLGSLGVVQGGAPGKNPPTSASTANSASGPTAVRSALQWFDETNGGSGFANFAALEAAHSAWTGPIDDLVDFESLAFGTKVTNQFAAQGVIFSGTSGGNHDASTGVRAEGDPNSIENLTGYDGSYQPDGSQVYLRHQNTTANPDAPVTITFDSPQRMVAAFVAMGVEGAVHSATVTAYDTGGAPLGQRQYQARLWEADPVTNNYETLIAVRSEQAEISAISILNDSLTSFADALILDTVAWSSSIRADQDEDGDVDRFDYVVCHGCVSGPAQTISVECEPCDLDNDLDVDLADQARLQWEFTGCTAGCLTDLFCYESDGQVLLSLDVGDPTCSMGQAVPLTSMGPSAAAVESDPPPFSTGVDVAAELVQMTLSGLDPLLGDVSVRERTDAASPGGLVNVVADGGGGLSSADAFFNMAVEIELTGPGLVLDTGFDSVTWEASGVTAWPSIGSTLLSQPGISLPLFVSGTSTQVGWLCQMMNLPTGSLDCLGVTFRDCIYTHTCIKGNCSNCPAPPPLCVSGGCTSVGTCATGFTYECPNSTCCVGYTLQACRTATTEPTCASGNSCPCQADKGACCDLATGACTQTYATQCGGLFAGPGIACGPTGACCFGEDTCLSLTKTCCKLLSGSFFQGQSCDPDVACCHGDGTCTFVPKLCCMDDPQPAGSTCQPMGACCESDGSCTFTAQDCCDGQFDSQTDCSGLGACCMDDGTCTETTGTCCTQANGQFQGVGTTCEPTGACCRSDGTCEVVAEVCCQELGDRFLGAGVACHPDVCCEANLEVDSNNDGGIDDADDAIEENAPGRIVPLNHNDSNMNGTLDLNEEPVDPLDPDLALLIVTLNPDEAPGRWKLTFPSRIQIYTDDSPPALISSGTVMNAPAMPNLYLIEGVQKSASAGDVTITLDYDCDDDGNFESSDQVRVTVAKIESVTYRPTGDGTTGDLSNDNPTVFGDGYRFFPGAASVATRNMARNIVRIRAVVSPPAAEIPVYFRSFDVDDPSSDTDIDPDGDGLDNRGTVMNVLGGELNWPGTSHVPNGAGYQGRLRPIGGAFEADGGVLEVNTALGGGEGRADVELATSFNPGDNFRVVASLAQSELANIDPANGVPTTGEPPAFADRISDQLSIWRRLHLEQDRMTTASGDSMAGNITSIGVPSGGQVTVTTDIAIQPATEANSYENGILRTAGVNYSIVGNTTGAAANFTINTTTPPSTGAVTVYQDDWMLSGSINNPPSTRIDTQDDSNLYDMVAASSSVTSNRFADAYLEPDHDKLNAFDDLIPASTHLPDANTNGTSDGGDVLALVSGHLGANGSKTDIFWIAYVSTAFEPIRDFDPDFPTKSDDWAATINGQPPASLIYLEQIRDYSGLVTETELRKRATVHEIGHQLDIAATANEHRAGTLMDANASAPAAGSFFIHPTDVATLRLRVVSP